LVIKFASSTILIEVLIVRDCGRPSVDGMASYQMHSMAISRQQQQQQQVPVSQSGPLPVAPILAPNVMSSELIGVDCIQLSHSGRYVVAGSVHGPPQVWDLQVAFRSPAAVLYFQLCFISLLFCHHRPIQIYHISNVLLHFNL